jgi:stearoyl-CoA desaturase (delta-9 desaturase)
MKQPLERQAIPALFDEKVTLKNWHRYVYWYQALYLIITPILSIYGLFTTYCPKYTAYLSLALYLITMLGITAGNIIDFFSGLLLLILIINKGYHRLWAHRSYRATPLLRLVLCIAATGAVQGSIKTWCRDHRAHHRQVYNLFIYPLN